MGDPIRYSEVSNDWNGEAAGLAPSADGEWVKWDDYAALLASNERGCQRFAKTQCEANEAESEVADLKAEVERLRIEVQRLTTALRTCDRIIKPLRDKAAKENKQS